MSYKRLTKRGGFSMDLDLSQELGYSHIYQRLSELEDKIEDGERGFLKTPRYHVGDVVFYLRDTETGEPEIVQVPVRKIYIGLKTISYDFEVGQYWRHRIIKETDKNLCSSMEEAQKRLAEIKEHREGDKNA